MTAADPSRRAHVGGARCGARRAALLLLLLAAPLRAREPAPPPAEPDFGLPALPSRSRSGHFEASGSNAVTRLEALGWAEAVADKAERLLGAAIPFPTRPVSIVVEEDGAVASGRATAAQSVQRGELLLRLTLRNPDAISPGESCEALCRLLLGAFAFDLQSSTNAAPAAPRVARTAPRWLSEGLARNVYPEFRVRDGQQCLDLWQSGEGITVAEILRTGAVPADAPAAGAPGAWADERGRAVYGVFFGWLLSFPQHKGCLQLALRQVAGGAPLAAGLLVPFAPRCASISDLEEAWDRWMLRQQRVVTQPGTTTTNAMDLLGSELLLYPGVSGIPLDDDGGRGLHFRDVIEQRRADWVPAFAAAKAVRLRLLALGRGREFQDVVDAYCRFLEALGARKKESALRSLLAGAEGKWAELNAKFGQKPAAGAAPAPATADGESDEHTQDDRGED